MEDVAWNRASTSQCDIWLGIEHRTRHVICLVSDPGLVLRGPHLNCNSTCSVGHFPVQSSIRFEGDGEGGKSKKEGKAKKENVEPNEEKKDKKDQKGRNLWFHKPVF